MRRASADRAAMRARRLVAIPAAMLATTLSAWVLSACESTSQYDGVSRFAGGEGAPRVGEDPGGPPREPVGRDPGQGDSRS